MTTETTPLVEETEAYNTLLPRVGRKSPKIPADVLVRHVLRVVPAQEWPTRLEAMDALLRRMEMARKDELRIDARPEGRAVLGLYATRRRGSGVRPYRTRLAAIEPIEGGCDCPDFLKNSLGICKHMLTILENIHAKPRLLQQALKEQAWESPLGGLRWNPIRPMTGVGDWLERISWPRPDGIASKSPRSEREAQALRAFRAAEGNNGEWVLRKSFLDDPPKRLALVEDLLKFLPTTTTHDPALRALLVGERDRLKRKVKATLTGAELKAAFKGLRRTLYAYQSEGVSRFLADGRLLLADDMGLGKTAQAIACCDILWRTKRIRSGLIIAPASLKPQWAREWAVFSDLPIFVVDGAPAERKAIYEARKAGFLIINYEQLIRDLEVIRKWAPDLIVLDEAQRIKNWATKTALSVKGLTPPYRLVLTGTPMENRIEELASVVEWVDDMALEPKWRLSALHAIRADGRREIIGVRGLDTLRDRLKGCMVRRIRQEVLDQLPPRTDTRVPVEMTEPQLDQHDALIPSIVALVQRARTRPLTQAEFLRLMSLLTTQRIISNGLAQLDFEDVWPTIQKRLPEEAAIAGLWSPKLLEIRQLIRQLVLEQNRKVVIFSQWRRMLTLAHWAVGDLLADGRLRAGFFTGAEGQKRRTQNIVEFHDDPACRLLFASDAGGVGLNLQHASNCVINMELPWNPAVLEQRIGRVYRLGQKQPIDVFNLVCEEGIESRIAGLVGSKQAFFKGLFDGESDAIQFEQSSSFLSRVEKIYDGAALSASSSASNVDGAPAELADAELDLEDDVDRDDPFEPLLDAADESQDQVETVTQAGSGNVASATAFAADGAELEASAPPSAAHVRQLFSKLRIRRGDEGQVVIEAPAEAASALSALFEGMAALLQSASTGEQRE